MERPHPQLCPLPVEPADPPDELGEASDEIFPMLCHPVAEAFHLERRRSVPAGGLVKKIDIPQTTLDEPADQSSERMMLALDAREIIVTGKLTRCRAGLKLAQQPGLIDVLRSADRTSRLGSSVICPRFMGTRTCRCECCVHTIVYSTRMNQPVKEGFSQIKRPDNVRPSKELEDEN